MSEGHMSNDEFLASLNDLFSTGRTKDHGSIYLTQKCMTYSQDAPPSATPNIPFPDLNPAKPLPIIIRATNGKSKEKRAQKIKLSTIVEVAALEGFYARYAEVCKVGMSGLKKRDRSKAKEKLKAKKKKQGAAGAGAADVKS
ncbi:signal recognition particle 14kD protein-domain-containing protein [Calycina marina]|uniref:Signal recognition particle subunit SRP14 n=1 Tax=Calycina marina TaxID=1763456 RepID=A0A9P7ZCG1_9HELO|nr:signal recognition particle 14kD protein-domain-containing protein [Calycina marina]